MELDSTKVIRFPELRQMLGGISRITVFRWERAGNFPKRIQLGKKTIGWKLNEIETWIDKKQLSKEN